MKPVEIRDLYTYSFYGNLKTCGLNTVFVRARADEKLNRYEYDLMLWRRGSLQQLTSRQNISRFAFENEETIWFVQPEACGSSLWKMSLNGGEALHQGNIEKNQVSIVGFGPGGRPVLCAREKAGKKPEEKDAAEYEVLEESGWYSNGEGFVSKVRTSLFLWDQETGCSRNFAAGLRPGAGALVMNNRLYFSASKDEGPAEILYEDSLYETDLETGERKKLCDCHVSLYTLDASSKRLLAFGSDGTPIGLNSNPCLYEYRFEDGQFEKALFWGEALGNTVGTDCAVVLGNSTCMDRNRLCFTSTIVSHTNLFCLENRALHQLLEWPGTIHSFGFCEGNLIFIGARPGELQELYLQKDQKIHRLSRFQSQMEDTFISQAKPVFYTGCRHSQQMGWVLYPKDFDPQKSYPAILDIHGGPKTVYGTVFYHEMQLWASHGYFVFFCNPFGSDGQGNSYADLRGKYGTVDFADLMTFTDTVLEQIPQIDPERLGVTGGSYGGFMTNWIIGHTGRFKAAVSQRSISNWISFLGTSDIGAQFVPDQIGCGLDDPAGLWKHSPLRAAENALTPTLFIHADEDYRCPIEQGYQMFNALLQKNVKARMTVFHGENHDLSRTGRPAQRIRRLEEITRWMDFYLKGIDDEA